MKCRANKLATRTSLIRALSFSSLFALTCVPAIAAEDSSTVSTSSSPMISAPATTNPVAAAQPATTPVAAAPVATAPAAPDPEMTASIPVRTRFLSLGIGKSVVIDLPRDAKDVLVADPKIANAVIRSPQRAYIIGAGVGQTNVVFFDAGGNQISSYDIAIKRDLNGIRTALRQSLPGVQIEGVGDAAKRERQRAGLARGG